MTASNVSIQFECPLHYGEGYDLECLDCRSMPTLMPDITGRRVGGMSTERSTVPIVLLTYGIMLLLIALLAYATMTTTNDHEKRIQQLEQKK